MQSSYAFAKVILYCAIMYVIYAPHSKGTIPYLRIFLKKQQQSLNNLDFMMLSFKRNSFYTLQK